MKVSVTVMQTTLEGEYGGEIDGIVVECDHCGHSVEVYGTSESSEKRGCVMLNEECPNGKNYFYEVN